MTTRRPLTLLALAAACLALAGCAGRPALPQRYGMIIGVKPEKLDYYKQLHANPWPGVVRKIRQCNIRNYSIYLRRVDDRHYYLFSYFEYVGRDFKGDLAKMAADPETQRWWKETDPCQIPIASHAQGEWWSTMEEVFHAD
jgi:L-rhamnose mutarotase